MSKILKPEFLIVLVSILVQVPLAVFLGHYYDQRSFLDTGYLVSAGLNPYQPNNITIFSSNPLLTGINPVIGYPPLWPLLLGAIYRLTYNITPNLFLYNFATKIPVIASNIALAYAVKIVLHRLGTSQRRIQLSWLFLLFNPFTLLTTTAWGEFDTLIALLCVSSLFFLSKCMVAKSSLLLSLSLVIKPISLPLIGLPLLCSSTRKAKRIIITLLVAFAVLLALWFLPFYFLNWIVPSQFTAYFQMAGGMTAFSAVEIFTNTGVFPVGLQFLGYLWIPALLVGYYFVYRHPPKSMVDLVQAAAALMLIFFLTRSWLSEPNFNVIIALALLAFPLKKLTFANFTFLWVMPLAFMVFNTSFAQLFFLVSPSVIQSLAQMDLYYRGWRLIARFVVAIVFQVFAWRLVVELLNPSKNSKSSTVD